MSAICAFRRRAAVFMMTDGLSYVDGTPSQVDCHKAHRVGEMKVVLSCTGPALLGSHLAMELADQFNSFDQIVEDGAETIRQTFLEFAADWRDNDAVSTLGLIGWHEASARPGLYWMSLIAGEKKIGWIREKTQVQDALPPFEMTALGCASTPSPTKEQYFAAAYNLASDLETVDAETDLLHQLEIARRMLIDGRSFVGGNALLTEIDAEDVRQRVVHCWEEDEPGKPVRPRPIDWQAWLAARRIPTGLSRLQRERMEKKLRKGKLR